MSIPPSYRPTKGKSAIVSTILLLIIFCFSFYMVFKYPPVAVLMFYKSTHIPCQLSQYPLSQWYILIVVLGAHRHLPPTGSHQH